MLHGLRRTLRSRSIIIAELLLVAASGVTLTLVPQVGDNAPTKGLPPLLGMVASALGLDHVLGSVWFSALLALSAVTLGLVLWDQWRRAVRVWDEPLTPAHFHGAPFTSEFVRAPRPGDVHRTRFHVSANVGILGAPVFHAGLMCVMVAGLVRVLFGQDAQVDLVEGETLPADASAYGAQWGGLLASPFALTESLRLDGIHPVRYNGTGNLESLSATVTLESHGGAPTTIAVNTPLDVGWERLYLSSLHGPAVMMEHRAGSEKHRTLLLLKDDGEQWVYKGRTTREDGLEVLARINRKEKVGPYTEVELRVLRGGGLLFGGVVPIGNAAPLGPDEAITIHGIRQWARFNGSRDVGWWLAYLGFALIILGAILMFGVTRVDTMVDVSSTPEGERVRLALKPHRFAPLYADSFEALRRQHGADTEKTP